MTCYLTAIIGLVSMLTACDAPGARNPLPNVASLAAASADDTSGTRVRRVWAHAGTYSTPSPDGRYVTFVDWNTGDVAVRDLASGEQRRITDKGPWRKNASWAEEPLFSPDGKQVAYGYGNVQTGDPFRYELRMVSIGDTTQQLLYAIDARDVWMGPLSWSTQGILVEINRGENSGFLTEFAVLNPRDKSTRVLATFKKGEPHPHDAFFSPDGRSIAVRAGKDLIIMAADGSGSRSLGIASNSLLGWTPDGRYLLVHAARDGAVGIWAVPVNSAGRAGTPVLVRGGIPALMPGGFANNSYFYVLPVDAPKVFVSSVDIAAGRMLAPPVAITSPVEGSATLPAWSPDGRTLAYVLSNPAETGTRFILRAADGDELRELAETNEGDVRQLFWQPDGQALYARFFGSQGLVLKRIDVRTGEITQLPLKDINGGMAITPDGRSLVLARHAPAQGNPALWHYDIASGRERRISELPRQGHQALSVSPDGKHIAYLLAGKSTLVVQPIIGGDAREVMTTQPPLHIEDDYRVGALPWTPDGQYILIQRGNQNNWHELLAVPAAGGVPVQLFKFDGPQLQYITLNADGRRVAYTAGALRQELWVIDEFLDKLK